MKVKRGRSSYVLLVGMMSLLMVGAWITYQIYSSFTKSQITSAQQTAIIPLDGSISLTPLDNLKGRRRFTNADFSAIVLSISPTPTASEAGGVSGGLGQ